MQVLIEHPVPVRWTPPRGRGSRVSYLATRTRAELPEVPDGAIGVGRCSFNGTHEILFDVHDGRCWERLERSPQVGMDGVRAGPVTLGEFAAALSDRHHAVGDAFQALTPLRAPLHVGAAARGEDLPDAVLARAGADLTGPVRAALARWVERNLATDGRHVYVTCALGCVRPHGGERYTMRLPWSLGSGGAGLAFGLARAPAMPAYYRAVGHRGLAEATRSMEFLHASLSRFPRDGEDLALFVNDAPVQVDRLYERARARLRREGCDLAAVEPAMARLRAIADLGSVRAIPDERRAEAVETLAAAMDALRAAVPRRHPLLPLNWLRAYATHVAAPGLRTAMPAEDAESLAGLSPGP